MKNFEKQNLRTNFGQKKLKEKTEAKTYLGEKNLKELLERKIRSKKFWK